MNISGISKPQQHFRLSLGNFHVYPNQKKFSKIHARIMVADVRDKGYLRARRSEIGDVEFFLPKNRAVKRGHLVKVMQGITFTTFLGLYNSWLN